MIRKFFGAVGVLIVALVAMGIANLAVRSLTHPKPPTQQETRAKAEAMFLEEASLFRILKQDFPENFEVVLSKLSQFISSEMPIEELGPAARSEVAKIRVKYAPAIKYAPDPDLQMLLRDNMELHRLVLQQAGSDACDQMLRRGAAGAPPAFIQGNKPVVDRLASHMFEAIRRSIDRPSPRVREASDEDWATIVEAMLSNGVTKEELDNIVTAETNLNAANLCPAGIKMFEAVLAAEGEGGHRIRSTVVSNLMQAK